MLINVNQLFLMLHRLNVSYRRDSLGMGVGWGWVRQDHSQGQQPGPRSYPRSSKVMSRSLSRSNVKIILKDHSKSFQGQT